MGNNIKRVDRDGTHRSQFEKNKKRIYATQEYCGICGHPVDKKLKYPDPMSKCIDHIIPIVKGGHPSAMDNLQLAHLTCNLKKNDRLGVQSAKGHNEPRIINNRLLPQSINWVTYSSK